MLTVVPVASAATVRNVAALYADILSQYRAASDIEIDLGQVEDVDLSLPQLLMSLRAAAAEAGREVRLRAPAPSPVAALLERAGFLAAATPHDLDFWFHGEAAR